MNILLTGASGFIGHHILQALQQTDYKVTACCRRPEKLFFASNDTVFLPSNYANMTAVESWLPHLHNIDIVINCVGIIAESPGQRFHTLHEQAPIALFQAAEQAGVKKIIQLSALGADENAQSDYHLSKKAADDALRQLTLDWYILQPSIVYGHGAQSTALFHALAALPILAVIDEGKQLLQPVHINDVVAAVMACLETKKLSRTTVPVVGPQAIEFGSLLQQLRKRLGKPPAPTISLSEKMARSTIWLGDLLDEPILNADAITMLSRSNTADSQPLEELLDRPPVDLQRQLLSEPANQAERWHAGLYFLRPLLRLSIACLWIWSGIVSIFFYPHELSYRFLSATGITGTAAPLALYGLALFDVGLGIATFLSFRPRRLIPLQLIIVALYTLTITIALPEFWLHPFGPVLKNIPLLIALLVYLQLEGEKP